jgi:hypothetical protein
MHLSLDMQGRNMEDEEQNLNLARKESTTGSPAEEVSSLHSTHGENKEQMDERESSLSMISIININLPNPNRLRY